MIDLFERFSLPSRMPRKRCDIPDELHIVAEICHQALFYILGSIDPKIFGEGHSPISYPLSLKEKGASASEAPSIAQGKKDVGAKHKKTTPIVESMDVQGKTSEE